MLLGNTERLSKLSNRVKSQVQICWKCMVEEAAYTSPPYSKCGPVRKITARHVIHTYVAVDFGL